MPHRAFSLIVTVLCLPMLGGCGTKGPQLETIDAAIPAGVDLSGRWRLRGPAGDSLDELPRTRRDTIVLPPDGRSRVRQSRGDDRPSVYLFLEFGRDLKVTQTEHGLFISFDRAIVEEYRFREHRTVNIGPIEAERVSGWEAGAYVIRTADDKGAILTERYALEDEGRVLLRSVRVDYRSEEPLSLEHRYERVQ